MIGLNHSLLEKKARKRSNRKGQHKVIFLHDCAPLPVQGTSEALGWEVLPHDAAYSPDLAPSDYRLFTSMGVTHLLSSVLVRMKMWKNGSVNGSQEKRKIFTVVVFTNRDWQAIEPTLNKALFVVLPNLTCFLKESIVISYLYVINDFLN